jgi:hypothetical protein
MRTLEWVKLKLQGFARLLHTDLRDLLRRDGRLIDETLLRQVHAQLVLAGLAESSARSIIARTRLKYAGRVVSEDVLLAALRDELRRAV